MSKLLIMINKGEYGGTSQIAAKGCCFLWWRISSCLCRNQVGKQQIAPRQSTRRDMDSSLNPINSSDVFIFMLLVLNST
jgi:hypothetical protein